MCFAVLRHEPRFYPGFSIGMTIWVGYPANTFTTLRRLAGSCPGKKGGKGKKGETGKKGKKSGKSGKEKTFLHG